MSNVEPILTDLAKAQQALQRSSTAFDEAIASMRDVLAAIATASHANTDAMTAVVAATNAALRLVQTNGGPQ